MSEDNKLLLNQYFSSEDLNQTTGTEEVDHTTGDIVEASKQLSKLKLNDDASHSKSEPEVCRIFAETPPQPKDPTAAFFDLIGNSTSSEMNSGIMSSLGMSSDVRLKV